MGHTAVDLRARHRDRHQPATGWTPPWRRCAPWPCRAARSTRCSPATRPTLLADLDRRLASLPPGIVATWNGSRLRPSLPRRPGPPPRGRPQPPALPRSPAHPRSGPAARPRRRLPGRLGPPRPPRHVPALRPGIAVAHVDLAALPRPPPRPRRRRRPHRSHPRPRQRGPPRPRRQRCPPGPGPGRAALGAAAAPGRPPGAGRGRGGGGGRPAPGERLARHGTGAAPRRRHRLTRAPAPSRASLSPPRGDDGRRGSPSPRPRARTAGTPAAPGGPPCPRPPPRPPSPRSRQLAEVLHEGTAHLARFPAGHRRPGAGRRRHRHLAGARPTWGHPADPLVGFLAPEDWVRRRPGQLGPGLGASPARRQVHAPPRWPPRCGSPRCWAETAPPRRCSPEPTSRWR